MPSTRSIATPAAYCAYAEEVDVITSREIKAAVEELNWKEHELSAGTHPEQSSSRQGRRADHLMRIEVRNQGETIAEHYFGPGRVIIGRSPDNEIYIQSKFVSRHHAQLVSDQYGCAIEDLNSTNGVFIGEERIKKHRLKDGDVISLGIHELVYTDLRAAQTPALKERRG
jgi:hypothetical protein